MLRRRVADDSLNLHPAQRPADLPHFPIDLVVPLSQRAPGLAPAQHPAAELPSRAG